MLRALLGLVAADAGEATLDGRPVRAWTRRELAESIAALPQREEPAFPLTVREAVLMGRWSRLGPIASVTESDELAIASALARCDVTGFERRGIETLSGGEWQRVRLARALASTPRLLLLDEPTAALDIGHEMELFELLRELVADGLGVLVITHQLNLAARYRRSDGPARRRARDGTGHARAGPARRRRVEGVLVAGGRDQLE